MTLDYQKVWNTMNELEMVTSKICSAREIIDAAIDRIQEHQYDKAETMMSAAHEFLGYYLDEFDKKFKDAWQETVVNLKQEESDAYDSVIKERKYYEPSMPPWGHSDMEYLLCNKDDSSPECKGAWNDFWEDPKDKVTKWVLPIEVDGPSEEYYITLPDDLQDAANIHEGDTIEWIDLNNGSFEMRKVNGTV